MGTQTGQPSIETGTSAKTQTKVRVQLAALSVFGLLMAYAAIRMWILVSINGGNQFEWTLNFSILDEIECWFIFRNC